MGELATRIRNKYPGSYDQLSDSDLEARIVAKFPGVYDHLTGGGKTYGNPNASPEEAERMRREFVKNEGTLETRVRQSTPGQVAKNVLLEAPRFAQEMVTVPLSSAKKSVYGLGALARTGGELIRGKDLDTALQAGTQVMEGFTPIHGPLDPSMTGEAIGTGITKLSDMAENATGNTGWAGAGIQAGADVLGLVGGGKMVAKGGGKLADLSRGAAGKVAEKLDITPTSLARSAVKPYMGESAARQAQTAKGLNTIVADKNASARMPVFLKRNLAEMEEIAGRQDVLLSEKGDYMAPITAIRQSLQETIDKARETPGTADATAAAAEKVLKDIIEHPKYDAASDSIPLALVQTMKKNIWSELRKGGQFNKDNVPGLQDAMWDAATGMNKIVNEFIPEMAGENARYGEIANVNKLLKRAVDRHANNNIIPLRALIQLVRGDAQGFATAASTWALDHPTFKLYVAQRMAKAKGRKPSTKEVNTVIEGMKTQLGNPQEKEQP